MKHFYTPEQVQQCCTAYATGKPISALSVELGIPKSTIYTWIRRNKDKRKNNREIISLKSHRLLEQKVKRLEGIIQILKRIHGTVNIPIEEKIELIAALEKEYSVRMICDALGFRRGTYYYRIDQNNQTSYDKRKEELKVLIQQIYDDNGHIFGAEKITAILKEQGEPVTAPTVRILMQEMGLTSMRLESKKLYDKENKKYPNRVNQQFNPTCPNQIWVGDVTQFRFNNCTYYISAIMDLYARKIIAYRAGRRNSTQLVKSTFKSAYESRHPTHDLIFHTDRGGNYRSKTFCKYLAALNVKQSFSRSRVPYDNSVIESFFSSFKREELYRVKYRSEYEFRTAINTYMEFYNESRPHKNNKYLSPNKKEAEFFQKQKEHDGFLY